MAKRGSPALYELIRARGNEPAAPPLPAHPGLHAADDPHEPPLPGGWLRPGRVLRVPLGYVFVAVAAAVVLASLTYMAGYSRGNQESRVLHPDEADRLVTDTAGRIPRDPLDSASQPATASHQPLASHQPPPPAGRPPRQWGPIESDPRQSGLHYLILMTTNRSGAERFIDFARERGLETYMITSDNRSFRVIALPGFADHNSNEAAEFRESVLRLGRAWMEQERTRVNPVGTSMWSYYGPRN